MLLLGLVIWVLGALLASSWMHQVRTSVRGGQGVTQQTVNIAMLFVMSLFVVLFSKMPSFHLLWMFPVSFLFGTLSLVFPFTLLSIPGRFFGSLCCIGLDKEEVTKNTAKLRRYQELHISGLSPEKAFETFKKMNTKRKCLLVAMTNLLRRQASLPIREILNGKR